MSWAAYVGAEDLARLIRRYGSPDAAFEEAQARPGFAETFREYEREEVLGLQFRREPPLPPDHWDRAYATLVVAALADDEPRPGGRPPGSFVEPQTFWRVWELALENHSARSISDATDRRSHPETGLEFVNREKVGVIVDAVSADRHAARHALSGRKTPKGFLATPYGMRLPDS